METKVAKGSNHGANVRRWREWRGINQDTLAEQIGVSQASLSGYEKREKLEPEILDKIAQKLDIPVEAITHLNDDTSINIVANNFNDSSSAIQYKCYINLMDKVIELYDKLLQSEKEKNTLLQEALKNKK